MQQLTAEEIEQAYDACRSALNHFKSIFSKYRLDPEDVLHDCMLKVVRHRHTFKNNSKFSTWVYRIAYNTILNIIGAADRRKDTYADKEVIDDPDSIELPAMNANIVEDILQEERMVILAEMVEQLPPSLQAVVKMMLEGEDYKEIARKLNIPRGTVQSRMFTLRHALASMLEINYKYNGDA